MLQVCASACEQGISYFEMKLCGFWQFSGCSPMHACLRVSLNPLGFFPLHLHRIVLYQLRPCWPQKIPVQTSPPSILFLFSPQVSSFDGYIFITVDVLYARWECTSIIVTLSHALDVWVYIWCSITSCVWWEVFMGSCFIKLRECW